MGTPKVHIYPTKRSVAGFLLASAKVKRIPVCILQWCPTQEVAAVWSILVTFVWCALTGENSCFNVRVFDSSAEVKKKYSPGSSTFTE